MVHENGHEKTLIYTVSNSLILDAIKYHQNQTVQTVYLKIKHSSDLPLVRTQIVGNYLCLVFFLIKIDNR